jgi:hypothetical protein
MVFTAFLQFAYLVIVNFNPHIAHIRLGEKENAQLLRALEGRIHNHASSCLCLYDS